MGDDEEQLESEGDSGIPPKTITSKLIKLLITIAIVVGSLIVVFIISYLVAKSVKGSEYEEVSNVSVIKSPPPLTSWSFPEEFRVNTADSDTIHFVKARISLGYSSGQLGLQAELTQRTAQLQDLINIIFQGKRKSDLTGTVKQLSLRDEIKTHINHILRDGVIEEVYFPEFIVN